ncbi:MAG TPA: porin [Vicinamibacterales bacterium]|jgi:hypothetical protein|nr:porin [Vicinamibacterales bacterium]
MILRRVLTALVLISTFATAASAQVTPAAGYTPPDDTPSIRVGVTLFPLYTYQTTPEATDADGNSINRSSFDVARAYINITGQISHLISFRITPDITRESALLTLPAGGTVSNDSLVYRIKYAYAQFNLDDWMTKGSWARIGIQQTPWVDFDEGIYRYRFQGTTFAERLPLLTTMTSADAGASFHYNLPDNYGDFHVGVYNGENYQRVEVNNDKAFEFRGTVRPFAKQAPVLRGLRAHLVYYNDAYVGSDVRERVMGNLTFEHQFVNGEFDYLKAKDKTQATAAEVDSQGWAFWVTPKKPLANGASLEALIRYDHFIPNTASIVAPASTSPLPGSILLSDQQQNRWIYGAAYWFPHQGGVTTAIMLDYDGQVFNNITTAPVHAVTLHGLINF